MSYIVHQKVKGKTYAYEAESYWDSEKKAPRQRRRYLGVVDEVTGQIVEKKFQRDIKSAKDYGPTYLLDQIAASSSCARNSVDVFGAQGEEILALAMAKVIKPDSLRSLHRVLEDSFLPEIFELKEDFTSQRLSRLIEDLGGKEAAMASFSTPPWSVRRRRRWSTTSPRSPSYSREPGVARVRVQPGRHGPAPGQPGAGGLVGDQNAMLIKLFPGSVTDVVTLRNLAEEARSIGIDDRMFIIDRGFYSEGNIGMLKEAGIDFIMPLPFGRKVGKGLISETNASIADAENARLFKDEVYHMIEEDLEDRRVKLRDSSSSARRRNRRSTSRSTATCSTSSRC